MAKHLSAVLVVIVLALNVACASSTEEGQGSSSLSAPNLIADGEWEFRVDRGLSESSSIERIQSDTLTEDDFVLVSEGVTDMVTVSADGTEVLIRLGASDDQLAKASLSAVVDGVARYEIDEAPGVLGVAMRRVHPG